MGSPGNAAPGTVTQPATLHGLVPHPSWEPTTLLLSRPTAAQPPTESAKPFHAKTRLYTRRQHHPQQHRATLPRGRCLWAQSHPRCSAPLIPASHGQLGWMLSPQKSPQSITSASLKCHRKTPAALSTRADPEAPTTAQGFPAEAVGSAGGEEDGIPKPEQLWEGGNPPHSRESSSHHPEGAAPITPPGLSGLRSLPSLHAAASPPPPKSSCTHFLSPTARAEPPHKPP